MGDRVRAATAPPCWGQRCQDGDSQPSVPNVLAGLWGERWTQGCGEITPQPQGPETPAGQGQMSQQPGAGGCSHRTGCGEAGMPQVSPVQLPPKRWAFTRRILVKEGRSHREAVQPCRRFPSQPGTSKAAGTGAAVLGSFPPGGAGTGCHRHLETPEGERCPALHPGPGMLPTFASTQLNCNLVVKSKNDLLCPLTPLMGTQ